MLICIIKQLKLKCFFLFPDNSANHGRLQFKGHGLEGAEKDPQQHGLQKLCANVH